MKCKLILYKTHLQNYDVTHFPHLAIIDEFNEIHKPELTDFLSNVEQIVNQFEHLFSEFADLVLPVKL